RNPHKTRRCAACATLGVRRRPSGSMPVLTRERTHAERGCWQIRASTPKLSPEANQSFIEATDRLLGVKHKQLSFAQQRVAGTNFAHSFCDAICRRARRLALPSDADRVQADRKPSFGDPTSRGFRTDFERRTIAD